MKTTPMKDIERALIIHPPWADMIVDGKKIWELRSRECHIRGKIGIIEGGSGFVIGEVDIIGAEQTTKEWLLYAHAEHCVPPAMFGSYNPKWAWELANPVRYDVAVPYIHPLGAQMWVKL